MRPVYHVLSSAGVAIVVYGLSGSAVVAGASFTTGVMIDVDHLVDYFRARGLYFDWQDFMEPGYFKDSGQIIIPLHSIELLIVFGLLTPLVGWMTALGMATSFCLHLLMDIWAYPLHPLTYSFIFRWLHRFEYSVIVRRDE